MRFVNAFALTLVLLLSACTESSDENQAVTTFEGNSDLQNLESSGNGVSQSRILIKDLDDIVIATIDLGSEPKVSYQGLSLRTKVGSSGKRKYVDVRGQVLLKIKREQRAKIKLKSESGVLLWKVKRKADAIKISDNEEMHNAYKIKGKGAARAKLLFDEKPMGEVLVTGGVATVYSDSAEYRVVGGDASIASVLAFSDIPMVQRLIIMLELSQ